MKVILNKRITNLNEILLISWDWKMLKKNGVALITMMMLAGCQSTVEVQPKNDDTVSFEGVEYTLSKDGSIVLSADQYKQLRAVKDPSKFVRNQGEVELTEHEIAFLREEPEALLSLAGMAPTDNVYGFVRQGSLKRNLQRIMTENRWDELHFEGSDELVETHYVVKSVDINDAVKQMTEGYDRYACTDPVEKSVTVIKVNFEELISQVEALELAQLEADDAESVTSEN